jgi:hypothetical protein
MRSYLKVETAAAVYKTEINGRGGTATQITPTPFCLQKLALIFVN